MYRSAIAIVIATACACSAPPITPDPTGGNNDGGDGAGGNGGDSLGGSSSGGGGTSPGGFESGKRLKERYYSASDGARSHLGWRDTTLDLDCEFGKASDGQMRCLPLAAPVAYYRDSACTEPVVYSRCGKPDYASQAVNGCGARILSVGGEYNGNAFYAPNNSNNCDGATPPPGVQFYETSGEVSSETFVAATVQVEQ